MKSTTTRAARLILFLAATLSPLAILHGCRGSAGTNSAALVAVPQAGNVQQWDLMISNNTQWPLSLLPVNGSLYVPIIPPGTSVTVQIGFLPYSVTVYAETLNTPPFVYPVRVLTLGVDYSHWSSGASIGYY